MGQKLGPQARGTQRVYELDLFDANGIAITGVFAGTEALAAKVWAGEDQAVLATPAATWISGPLGTTRLTVLPSDIASLESDIYRLQAIIDPSGQAICYFDGELEISDAPGSAAALTSYCGAKDLYHYARWLNRIQGGKDTAGWIEQRHMARDWIDDIILSMYKPQGFLAPGLPGYNPVALAGTGMDPPPSKWLKDQLDANKLMVRTKLVTITALYSLYLICDPLLGSLDGTPYQKLAARYRWRAEQLVKTYRAEIDLNGSGYPAIVVHCGQSNLR